jgi:hypothetical protein
VACSGRRFGPRINLANMNGAGRTDWLQTVERMGEMLWILFLIVVLIAFGLGFVVKALFWVALVLFIVWLLGFLVGRGRGSRWYW